MMDAVVDQGWRPKRFGQGSLFHGERELEVVRDVSKLLKQRVEEYGHAENFSHSPENLKNAYSGSAVYWLFSLLVISALQFYGWYISLQSINMSGNDLRYFITHIITLLILYNLLDMISEARRHSTTLKLHSSLLKHLINAPLNLFFDFTPASDLISAFAQDMPAEDNNGVLVVDILVRIGFCIHTSPSFLLPTSVYIATLFCVSKYPPNNQKTVEQYISATYESTKVIRGFNKEKVFVEKLEKLAD